MKGPPLPGDAAAGSTEVTGEAKSSSGEVKASSSEAKSSSFGVREGGATAPSPAPSPRELEALRAELRAAGHKQRDLKLQLKAALARAEEAAAEVVNLRQRLVRDEEVTAEAAAVRQRPGRDEDSCQKPGRDEETATEGASFRQRLLREEEPATERQPPSVRTGSSFRSCRTVVRRESRMSSLALDRVRDADAALLLDEVEECGEAAVDLRDMARELQQRLPQTSWWLMPAGEVESLGGLLGRVSDVLQTVGAQLAPLAERLQLRREVVLEGAPKDEAGLRAFLAARLRLAPGGLVAVVDWGSARRGMRLVRVDSTDLSAGVGIEQLRLKHGARLTFGGEAADGVAASLQEVLQALEPMGEMVRLSASESLPLAGPPAVSPAEEPDSRLLGAWEARLNWGAQLTIFEAARSKFTEAATAYVQQAEGRLHEADKADAAALQAAVHSSGCPSSGPKGGQAAKATGGKGCPPPPLGKGPEKGAGLVTPRAGKGPPPPCQGLTTPRGAKGAPPPPSKGSSKGAKAPTPSQEATASCEDPVLQAVEKRRSQPLFGKRTRRPDQAMLNSQQRKFLTFVDSCCAEEGVADIGDAFGGRGRLLLHACIAEAPEQSLKSQMEQGSQELAAQLIQVVRGEEGKMGDKRRMDAEIRLRKFAPCCDGCAGLGLALPPVGSACRPMHELARALAGVDAEGLMRCARKAEVDLGAFLPEAPLEGSDEQDKAAMDRVEQAFLLPPERSELLRHGREGSVEQLHSLERRLLPLAHVTCLPEKVKLQQLCTGYAAVEKEVVESLGLAERACLAIRTSKPLLDLLAVTLQVASYVKNFGETDLKGQGFSLMRLQYYEGFWVGRQPFLAILAAFLRNLRPREPSGEAEELPVQRRRSANARLQHGTLATPRGGASVTARRRSGANFMNRLEKDLADAREAVRVNMSVAQLEAQLERFETMARFVERCIASELRLFAPEAPPAFAHERAAELEAWAGGLQRLRGVLGELRGAQSRAHAQATRLRAGERLLQEFAAVREEDFGSVGFLQVVGSVTRFVDQLGKAWRQQEASPSVHLQHVLLAAAPLQMLFGGNSLEQAFNLWMTKAQAAPSGDWSEGAKCEALQRLFQLFDTNADGLVDAEELRVTLRAFGIELPEDSQLHLEVVRQFDVNSDGQMDVSEFRAFVESRIQAAFRAFLGHGDAIEEADLERVARQLQRHDLDRETFQAMIHILDTCSSGQDGRVNLEEFEQLILMKPEPLLAPSNADEHELNQAAPGSARRVFAWDRPNTGVAQKTAAAALAEAAATRRKAPPVPPIKGLAELAAQSGS